MKRKGSGNKLGARAGKRIRDKLSLIEAKSRGNKCPYCLRVAIKRLSKGIWFCNKCESKFTGKAYSVN